MRLMLMIIFRYSDPEINFYYLPTCIFCSCGSLIACCGLCFYPEGYKGTSREQCPKTRVCALAPTGWYSAAFAGMLYCLSVLACRTMSRCNWWDRCLRSSFATWTRKSTFTTCNHASCGRDLSIWHSTLFNLKTSSPKASSQKLFINCLTAYALRLRCGCVQYTQWVAVQLFWPKGSVQLESI